MRKSIATLLLLSLQYIVNAHTLTAALQKGSLGFRENKGQITDQNGVYRSDIQFQVAAGNMNIFVGNGQMHYQFTEVPDIKKYMPLSGEQDRHDPIKINTYRLDVTLVGANTHAKVVTEDMSADFDNYYQAHCGVNGATKAHAYKKITYKNIYPSIDWVLYSNGNELEYDFVVHPGGDVADIKLRYDGANGLSIQDGALAVKTPMGSVNEHKPYGYTAEDKGTIKCSFVQQDDNTIGFVAEPYQGTLVIDPILTWATYFGGPSYESNWNVPATVITENGLSVASDKYKYVYMAGNTQSATNIATVGAFQQFIVANFDVFLVKFDSTGRRLWATYYGDITDDLVSMNKSIVCDKNGAVYMAGYTQSPSGLSTPGSHQPAIYVYQSAMQDAFLAKFDTAGQRVWGTYYGGRREEYDPELAYSEVDDRIYMVGVTNSIDSISTTGSHQAVFSGAYFNGFLVSFSPAGVRQWGTYYGGTGTNADRITTVTCDRLGNIYIGGNASNNNGIATSGTYQSTSPVTGSTFAAFVAKFNAAGVRQWGTYYNTPTSAGDIVCDDDNNVYMTGFTSTIASMTTAGAPQTVIGGGNDAYVVKFSDVGQRIWGTYLGGSGADYGTAMYAEGKKIYVAGYTSSATNIVTAPCNYRSTQGGSNDAFLIQYGANGEKAWDTYFGGTADDWGYSITGTGNDNIYMGGYTESKNDIAIGEVYQDTIGGSRDAFLTRFRRDEAFDLDIVTHTLDTFCAGTSPLAVVVHNNGPNASPLGGIITFWYSSGGSTHSVKGKSYRVLPPGTSDTLILDTAQLVIGTYNLTAYITHLCFDQSAANDTLRIPLYVVNNDTASVDTIAALNIGKNTFRFSVSNAHFITDYIWDFGDGTPLVHGGNPTHTYTNNGTYTVKLTANNRCSTDTASMVVVASQAVGISTVAIGDASLTIYPNPATDKIFIANTSGLDIRSVRIYNSVGSVVHESSLTGGQQISVGQLAASIYLVRIQSDKGYVTRKVELIK